ncbi:FliI/YscN family ATPase [Salipiger sp. IMCC34102]|uniref:FliI/YscN family ATPase n=1 Tax=Salipiger sp. IMCC34102 TaxID=2510647 RepID=UPI00101C28FB|nr:FliI/YscN family ATPase [Salipiger sp. IMCC34102]RYH01574.1 FliI/YscN family ATPase [Salipiger sp. IMCC34102]
MTDPFDLLGRALSDLDCRSPGARITAVGGASVTVEGFGRLPRLGDRLRVLTPAAAVMAEVVKLDEKRVEAIVEGTTAGLHVGQTVAHVGRPRLRPGDHWIGRVVDPDGAPLDGRPLLPGAEAVEVRRDPPAAHGRRGFGPRLSTGVAALNTVLPLVRGQRIGIFAGSGVGKSTLLGNLARGVEADVIVIALVGERGREVQDFVANVLGPEGMARSVLVAATSDRAPQVRRRCAQTATAVAEHFRDRGQQVLLLIDSVTRFCEAHREVTVAAGETANLRGHPASTAGMVAHLCERAGPGTAEMGDITAIYTVLVAGSDMEEPVADMLRGVLDGHIVLSREIAERGQFPAIDVPRSVSRSLPDAANRAENETIREVRRALSLHAESEMMIRAGLYQAGSDPALDHAVAIKEQLDAFLSIIDKCTPEIHFRQLRKALSESR